MKKVLTIALMLCSVNAVFSQKELKFNFNDDGSHYLKATFTGQVWLRYNESNPGTTVGVTGNEVPSTFDIGLRRVRSQIFGKISGRVFLYTQFGINNFNYNAARKPGIFFHDVVTEFYLTPRSLQIGAGLTAWTGFARYSSPSVATILGYDAPLYQQSTNDVNDQFLRKLSVYAKGKIGKVDYRLILSDPLMVDPTITTVKPISENADFHYQYSKLQTSGYFMFQFLDEESNLTPYMTGSYLGKKRVFNIGAGFQYQPDATWRWESATVHDTVMSAMLNWNIDLFYDHPLGTNGSAMTVYAAYSYLDYGKNYLRNSGAMNPGTSVVPGNSSMNGTGNAFPMYGTGHVMWGQMGYLLPSGIFGEKGGQLQPYADIMVADYDRLNEKMIMWDAGFNWLIEGQRSKITLNYQNRPVFNSVDQKVMSRKSMIVLQYQIAI